MGRSERRVNTPCRQQNTWASHGMALE